jgi:hypothetical protein
VYAGTAGIYRQGSTGAPGLDRRQAVRKKKEKKKGVCVARELNPDLLLGRQQC